MPPKAKDQEGLDIVTRLSQKDTVTGEASSSSAWEGAAFPVEPNHELDPDGDLVLILDPSSIGYSNPVHVTRSGGMVKSNRFGVMF